MRRVATQRGYALLAALVVTAVAAVFAAAVVAAVNARLGIGSADVASLRAEEAAKVALARVSLGLRRSPQTLHGQLSSAENATQAATWQATWTEADSAAAWSAATVLVEGAWGEARSRLSATLELRAERVPRGLGTAGDVELGASLRVIGSGLYSGGCVRGREWLDFGAAGATGGSIPPADCVYGDVWPRPGVHALGGVWAGGVEIHDAPGSPVEFPDDTDMHTGDNGVSRFVTAPEAALLIGLREDAIAPGAALHDGTLDLAGLPAVPPLRAGGASASEGYVVAVSAAEGGGLSIVGARPPGACPIVVAVQGDASLGEVGRWTELYGALLVDGRLWVQGPSGLRGHLFAGELLVSSPLTVELAPDWRERPFTGLVAPVVVALDRA